MASPKDINEIKATLSDIKNGLRWIYEMVGTDINENKATTAYVKYMANKMGFHESRIDENECDLCELMGAVDIIK